MRALLVFVAALLIGAPVFAQVTAVRSGNATGSVAVTSLPSLPAGTNAIGSVSVSNFPATSTAPISCRLTDGTSFYTAGGGASSFTINDPTVTSQKLGVDASGRIGVNVNGTVPVSGTFWQSTQPVSSTQLPAALDGSGFFKVHEQGTVPVTGTFWQATQPVSAASLPLPSGAAQDATLTGGTQKSIARGGAKGTTTAADVTSVSIDANTQALHVSVANTPAVTVSSGSVTVSGTVTANAGTGTMTTSDAKLPSGLTAPTASPAGTEAGLIVRNIPSGTQAVSGTFWQTTQPVSIAATVATSSTQLPAALDGSGFLKVHEQGTAAVSGTVTATQGTAAAASGAWFVKHTDGTNTQAVKAATTAPTTSDPAGVVVMRPDAAPVCTSVVAINQAASAQLVTGTASQKLYICSIVLVSATAQSVSLVEGTGTTCGTSTAGLVGGTTASMQLAANGGFVTTAGTPWLKTLVAADNLCLLQSSTGNVSGTITYVSAP